MEQGSFPLCPYANGKNVVCPFCASPIPRNKTFETWQRVGEPVTAGAEAA